LKWKNPIENLPLLDIRDSNSSNPQNNNAAIPNKFAQRNALKIPLRPIVDRIVADDKSVSIIATQYRNASFPATPAITAFGTVRVRSVSTRNQFGRCSSTDEPIACGGFKRHIRAANTKKAMGTNCTVLDC